MKIIVMFVLVDAIVVDVIIDSCFGSESLTLSASGRSHKFFIVDSESI